MTSLFISNHVSAAFVVLLCSHLEKNMLGGVASLAHGCGIVSCGLETGKVLNLRLPDRISPASEWCHRHPSSIYSLWTGHGTHTDCSACTFFLFLIIKKMSVMAPGTLAATVNTGHVLLIPVLILLLDEGSSRRGEQRVMIYEMNSKKFANSEHLLPTKKSLWFLLSTIVS